MELNAASKEKPLSILVVVNLPWDARLGATRVWVELAEQWRARGHVVEKFALSDAFPGVRATRVTFTLRQVLFIRKARAFVRQNARRFDVIDAMIGTLPFSKAELGFHGTLVARSVGLYLLYERSEEILSQRRLKQDRGKIVGRLLYRFARRRLRTASDRSVLLADLVNVPNESEAACLREQFGQRAIVVQPYGLTSEQSAALAQVAPVLSSKRVCFIGMWSPRKGAYDWPAIIARVRAKLAGVQFRFLGTMLEAEAIRADLGETAEGIEFISDYQPSELPKLLSDCAAGAFPSYVEGFGLGVIEQLAAGLPTVAYDTAGPRDILTSHLPELLTPSGDTQEFADKLVGILQLDGQSYRELSRRSRQTAAQFSWETIAETTLETYRAALRGSTRPIVFTQPFSLGSAGGGARILRALLQEAPFAWRSICSSPEKPRPWRGEIYLPSRPSWGRLEHTRFASLPKASRRFFGPRFRARLEQHCRQVQARAIHTVPHAGRDFAEAHAVARALSIPLFLSVHDDLNYTTAGRSRAREEGMQAAWREAAACFVISESLGREYCARYGERSFEVVTDGLTSLQPLRAQPATARLRIYFMGLFHMAYEENLRALLRGVAIYEAAHPGVSVELTFRCEHIRPQVFVGLKSVDVLPFADEAQIQRDLSTADLLYMPMPFGPEHESFARHSLSTKMVTYLGSGAPILYHGPRASAAFELLNQHRAALFMPTLDPVEIATALDLASVDLRRETAARALKLAEQNFMLADQARKFWGAISGKLAPL